MNIPAKQIVENIQARLNNRVISSELNELLERKYEYAKRYQIGQGVTFNLSLKDYLSLITKGQLDNMERRVKDGSFKRFMKSDYGYVLSWKDKAAKETKVMDSSTACFVNREKSKRSQQFKKGDKHSAESIELIRTKRTGTTHSDATKQKMRDAHEGTTMSDETKAKMSAAKKGRLLTDEQRDAIAAGQRRRHAERRAAKEAAERGNA